jgi:hypothetical protein
MSKSERILEYRGPVNLEVIEFILRKLKKSKEFADLDKTTRKRTYALVVECLENISKHSICPISFDKKIQPFITVTRENDKVIMSAGNSVISARINKVAALLSHINELDEISLKTLYEHKINRETVPEENGAGLGFIIMRLKAGNKIDYNFTEVDKELTYFQMQISINKYTMRKLIIEQTSNSPKVFFDPDNNFFEISGESRPPDANTFYTEIFNWFDDYSSYLSSAKDSIKPVAFDLEFEYFNSTSAKYLLDFCKQVALARLKGLDISIRWLYEEDDIDMFQAGKEMSRIAKFPFEYIQKDKL